MMSPMDQLGTQLDTSVAHPVRRYRYRLEEAGLHAEAGRTS
jgi:hypothetical protein